MITADEGADLGWGGAALIDMRSNNGASVLRCVWRALGPTSVRGPAVRHIRVSRKDPGRTLPNSPLGAYNVPELSVQASMKQRHVDLASSGMSSGWR
jgi:hypothetical protein